MTEAEWLACDDPMPMLRAVPADDRKLRLFAVASWQRIRAGQVSEPERMVVELFGRYVNDTASAGEWFEGFSGAGGVRLPDHIQFLLRPNPLTAAEQTARTAADDL